MKPEDKVCTLKQAKRLVDLGVVLETENYWLLNDKYVSDSDWSVDHRDSIAFYIANIEIVEGDPIAEVDHFANSSRAKDDIVIAQCQLLGFFILVTIDQERKLIIQGLWIKVADFLCGLFGLGFPFFDLMRQYQGDLGIGGFEEEGVG